MPDAFAGAFVVGLHEHREAEGCNLSAGKDAVLDEHAARNWHLWRNHAPGDGFVERQRESERIRTGARQAEQLANCCRDRFAAAASFALRQVKGAIETSFLQPPWQPAIGADWLDLTPSAASARLTCAIVSGLSCSSNASSSASSDTLFRTHIAEEGDSHLGCNSENSRAPSSSRHTHSNAGWILSGRAFPSHRVRVSR